MKTSTLMFYRIKKILYSKNLMRHRISLITFFLSKTLNYLRLEIQLLFPYYNLIS